MRQILNFQAPLIFLFAQLLKLIDTLKESGLNPIVSLAKTQKS